jgi:hypothetical protein
MNQSMSWNKNCVMIIRIIAFVVTSVAGTLVLWANQCSVFYGRRVFWFVLLNQPDVGCGSVKLRGRGGDYAGGACEH